MKAFFNSGKHIRAVAWLLVFTTVLGLFPGVTMPAFSVDGAEDAPYVMLDGEVVTQVMLEENAKLRFEAASARDVATYQWQIQDTTGEDRWINISDGASQYLWVTYALVGSMLQINGTAYLRCRMIIDGQETFTNPVEVTLSLNVEDEQQTQQHAWSRMFSRGARAANEEHTTYSIVINYLFDNNAIAFEPYGASVAAGSDFKATVKSPTVVGYTPMRRVGDAYIDATEVVFDLTNIQQDITINVIYEPALVNFSVHHHLQNILDDEYSVHYDLITTNKALTGTIVGDGLALTEEELPGFKALAYEKLPVAADGSTVVEIRYDRNYYLIDFDMAGGYGTEPVYTRYGAIVGANTPVRHGYVFDGWELVSYGGQTPTTEQQAKYALQPGGTIEVPAANLRYRARWITQETTYTMVFWSENANDPGYSYWGYLDNLPAMSGDYVSAEDYISRVVGIDDEQYFTFNRNKSDKDVLVEGDGSTVVNVYYTRNYYKITFKGDGKCTITPNHTHSDTCYDLICGLSHTHTDDCTPMLICPTPEHTAHTTACIVCGKEEHIHGQGDCACNLMEHAHTVKCWRNIGSVASPSNAPKDVEEGYIHRVTSGWNTYYYIYIAGAWYRYTGWGVSNKDIVDPSCEITAHTHGVGCACDKTDHNHAQSCYSDILHTHNSACYAYSCGLKEHVHDDSCKRLKCPVPEKHNHSDSCNNASSTNTVKMIYAKYGQFLGNEWPVTDDNGVKYDSGQRWKPSSSSYYNAVLVYISKMVPDDFTLTLDEADYKTFTMKYYLQALPGEKYDLPYDEKYYIEDREIKANYNYVTKAEDFFDIEGFVQYASNPKFGSNGQINSQLNIAFYYDRITDHYLRFNNNGTVLEDKQKYGIMYGAPLTEFNFVPSYPDNLEPNAYTFGGWYISPGCFPGTEVDWDTLTMPVGDLMLYAKWVPITHTVRVFKDANMSEQIGADQIVDHKAFASAPTGNVTNGNYVFQGWFYKDEVNGVIVEKAFAFNGIPVVDDMDIYAKWSSHVQVEYKISYKLQGTDIEIAAPTIGSAIAGHNKTFDAKAGDQLYAGYQQGYYPMTNSHTITMSVDGTHEFTFYYVYVASMPYKVQYLNAVTGEKLCDDKIVEGNTLSVVTETFQRFDKMMPDAYQKRLVLSANQTDEDYDGIYDANVITFYYSSDEEHAYYRVVHYIQNMQGDTYREYRSEEAVGIIGTSYTINALTLTGFAFNGAKTVINGALVPVEANAVTTVLGAEGMLIELYYDRQSYNYVVKYLDSTTREERAPDKLGTGVFGQQIVEYAKSLENLGYELVSDGVKTLSITANDELNIIEFLYQEKTVAIKYHVVGPAGCGVLSQYSENLTAINGEPNGSTPIAYNGFAFRGWYADPECTIPVDPTWVDADNKLCPVKTDSIWTAQNFYAKIVSLDTDLTITTQYTAAIDTQQAFIFHIQGKPGTETERIDLMVSIVGNGSVTITELPLGEYTVIELTDWSWRYENGEAQKQVTLVAGDNQLIYDNSRQHGNWLDGNAVKDNRF